MTTSECPSNLFGVGEVGFGGREARIILIYEPDSLHTIADYKSKQRGGPGHDGEGIGLNRK